MSFENASTCNMYVTILWFFIYPLRLGPQDYIKLYSGHKSHTPQKQPIQLLPAHGRLVTTQRGGWAYFLVFWEIVPHTARAKEVIQQVPKQQLACFKHSCCVLFVVSAATQMRRLFMLTKKLSEQQQQSFAKYTTTLILCNSRQQ